MNLATVCRPSVTGEVTLPPRRRGMRSDVLHFRCFNHADGLVGVHGRRRGGRLWWFTTHISGNVRRFSGMSMEVNTSVGMCM